MKNSPKWFRACLCAPSTKGLGYGLLWVIFTLYVMLLSIVLVICKYFGTAGIKNAATKVFIISGSCLTAFFSFTAFIHFTRKASCFVLRKYKTAHEQAPTEPEASSLALGFGESIEEDSSIDSKGKSYTRARIFSCSLTLAFTFTICGILWGAVDPKGSIYPSIPGMADAFLYSPVSYHYYNSCSKTVDKAKLWGKFQHCLENTTLDFGGIEFGKC